MQNAPLQIGQRDFLHEDGMSIAGVKAPFPVIVREVIDDDNVVGLLSGKAEIAI